MKKLTLACCAFFVVGGTSAWAGPLTIPNTFSANTPAVAAEVNANFTATKTAVDDNDSRITNHAADVAAHHATYTDAEAQTAAATPIAIHALIPNAHHTPYTDAMAQTAADTQIATHSAVVTAHHTRYTDAEAQTAAGTPIATHAADTSAHHAQYTDSAAVSAVLAADGSGSTLDADLLDGQDSGAFAPFTHTHTEGEITDLGNCPSDMVKVGPVCVDMYEAYVTEDLAGIIPTTAARCSVTGNDCSATDNTGTPNTTSAIYAQSLPLVTPSTDYTWFQAQQACANVGKRLLTNAEWQMAAAGTPDDGTCVAGGVGIASTGSVLACRANVEIYDMVGNVNEWVADWVQGDAAEGAVTAGTTFGDDRIFAKPAAAQGNSSVNMPAAVIRGGSHNTTPASDAGVFYYIAQAAPSYSDAVTGFRCAL